MQICPADCTRACRIVIAMNNTSTITKSATSNKFRIRVLAPLLALAASFGAIGLASSTAEATAWDPHVALTGRATCSPGIRSTVTWMWVSASNGEQGWAQLSGSGVTRSYRFDFYKVPTSGTSVTVKFGCTAMGDSKATFGLNRPSIGIYATRNLCNSLWTGPCLI